MKNTRGDACCKKQYTIELHIAFACGRLYFAASAAKKEADFSNQRLIAFPFLKKENAIAMQ